MRISSVVEVGVCLQGVEEDPHPFPIDDEDGVAHTLWAPTSPVRMMRGA
jgi:hypothetical protein